MKQNLKISLKQIEIFSQVAKHMSFIKAAKAMSITQPAITQHMQKLEAACGKPLVERIGKKLYLTKTGKLFLEHVHIIESDIEQLKARIIADSEYLYGTLTISITNALQYVMFKHIESFRTEHPHVHFNISVDNRQQQLDKLHNNAIDMCIMGKHQNNMQPFKKHLFSTNNMVLACSTNHSLANKRNLTLSDLKGETFLIAEPETENYRFTNDILKSLKLPENQYLDVNNHAAMVEAIKAGVGIALVPDFTVKYFIEQKSIKALNLDTKKYQTSNYIVYHKDKVLSPAAEKFRDFLIAVSKQQKLT